MSRGAKLSKRKDGIADRELMPKYQQRFGTSLDRCANLKSDC
jgi:hypothetical protein